MALGPINIVGDVTQLIEDLLIGLTPTLDSPADLKLGNNSTAQVNIYLFQVLENAYAKNQPWHTQPNGDQEYPALALNLNYLITPYAIDQISAHHVLSDAMRILHDNALVMGAQLPESLRLVVERLSISLMPMQLEELTRIWSALQTAYRLSVAYQVRVVLLRSSIQRTPARVLTKLDLYAQK